ncbi:hypothetical protein QUH24_28945, partial [Klebsiella pneumoniae]|nr:hypothetical protein [Klebsiella pneumoniae]
MPQPIDARAGGFQTRHDVPKLAALPDLSGVRLACCMHLDMKMIPLVQGILDKGAQVFLTTCNP